MAPRRYELTSVPGEDRYRTALLDVRISEGQRRMLLAHLRQPVITAEELAAAAGYRGWRTANLQYGRLGHRIADALAIDVARHGRNEPLWTSSLAAGERNGFGHWLWTLYPQVAHAIEALGWHR